MGYLGRSSNRPGSDKPLSHAEHPRSPTKAQLAKTAHSFARFFPTTNSVPPARQVSKNYPIKRCGNRGILLALMGRPRPFPPFRSFLHHRAAVRRADRADPVRKKATTGCRVGRGQLSCCKWERAWWRRGSNFTELGSSAFSKQPQNSRGNNAQRTGFWSR